MKWHETLQNIGRAMLESGLLPLYNWGGNTTKGGIYLMDLLENYGELIGKTEDGQHPEPIGVVPLYHASDDVAPGTPGGVCQRPTSLTR